MKHEYAVRAVRSESIYYIIIREYKKEEINGGTDAENESAYVGKREHNRVCYLIDRLVKKKTYFVC